MFDDVWTDAERTLGEKEMTKMFLINLICLPFKKKKKEKETYQFYYKRIV